MIITKHSFFSFEGFQHICVQVLSRLIYSLVGMSRRKADLSLFVLRNAGSDQHFLLSGHLLQPDSQDGDGIEVERHLLSGS